MIFLSKSLHTKDFITKLGFQAEGAHGDGSQMQWNLSKTTHYKSLQKMFVVDFEMG